MKKAFALLLSGTLFGLSVAAGVGLSNLNAVETKATATCEGTITIDTTGGDWAANNSDGSGQNMSILFSDGTNEGWGSYVYCAYQQYLVEITYSLDFTPTTMTAWRYSNWYGSDKWASDPKCEYKSESESHKWAKWNTAAPLTFAENSHIVIEGWNETYSRNNAETRYAYVHSSHIGGDSSAWGTYAQLTNVKLNGSNHVEYYGDVTFVKGQQFGMKLLDSDWSVSYTLDSYVTGAFKINDGGNIECVTKGTYSLYYDRNSASLYINDPVYASADEWAQVFLGTSEDACTTVTMVNWASCATSYAALSDGAKALMANLDYVDHTAEPSTYYAKAVQRYDYVLQRFGVDADAGRTDFMGRITNGKLVLTSNMIITPTENGLGSAAIAVLGFVGLSGVGLMVFFRRKRAL